MFVHLFICCSLFLNRCAYQVAAACDQRSFWLVADVAKQCYNAAVQSGKDSSHDNTTEGKASSEHSPGSVNQLIQEDEGDAPVPALHEPLLSECSSDDTHKDYDSILDPTTSVSNPVGDPAMPEGSLHKASWTFISVFR